MGFVSGNWVQTNDENNPANPPANMEPPISHAPLGAQEMPRYDSPVCILVNSYRHRLTDADNVSAKAAIDGIVKVGILSDDSPKQVKEVRFRQVKIPASEEEKTVITITEVK